jgi:DNA polymerase-3 subunit delta
MPLLLFHGDNDLEIEEAARALRGRFNPADVLTYDGAEVSLGDLSAAARTAGLFDPERLVIARKLNERLKGNRPTEAEAIATLLTDIAPTTTLLLVSPGMSGDHALIRLVKEAGGEIRAFMQPRKGDLGRWLVERGRMLGVNVDRDAAQLLADLVGSHPVMLQSELVKLATYAGEGERITPSMVDTLVGSVPQERIFDLVDSIAAGDSASAFRLLRAQVQAASGGPMDTALYLIRMLARQMRILLGVRLGLDEGRSRGHIIADLKLPRYFADRYFRQAQRLSTSQMMQTFEQLAALEFGLKSGTMDAAAGLDLLVGKLCA